MVQCLSVCSHPQAYHYWSACSGRRGEERGKERERGGDRRGMEGVGPKRKGGEGKGRGIEGGGGNEGEEGHDGVFVSQLP